jgi:hypothetical protein
VKVNFFSRFETVLNIQVYYLIISILLHVGLQTLVNHYHRMKADKEHTAQLKRIEQHLKDLKNKSQVQKEPDFRHEVKLHNIEQTVNDIRKTQLTGVNKR